MPAAMNIGSAYIELAIKGGAGVTTEFRRVRDEMLGSTRQIRTAMSQPGYLQNLKGMVAAQKQLTAEKAKFAQGLRVAEEGKFLAGIGEMKDILDNMARKLAPLGAILRNTFAAGTGAVLGFVAAASPDAIATLWGQVKLLSAAIGEAFVPIVIVASRAIQDLREWIRSLDPETRASIASWTLWTVGLSAAILVIPTVIGLLGKLAAAIRGVGVALAFLSSHPLVAALTLLAMALGYIGWKVYEARQAAKENADVTPEQVARYKAATKEKEEAEMHLQEVRSRGADNKTIEAAFNRREQARKNLAAMQTEVGIKAPLQIATPSMIKPTISGIEDMHTQLALQLAEFQSQGSIKAEEERRQQEQLVHVRETAANTAKINETLERKLGLR